MFFPPFTTWFPGDATICKPCITFPQAPLRTAHQYHDYRQNNINDYDLKSSIFIEVDVEFTKAVGHTLCSEIHKILYGKSFKLYEEEGRAAFTAAGGRSPEGCATVCSRAAGIAAQIIIDIK